MKYVTENRENVVKLLGSNVRTGLTGEKVKEIQGMAGLNQFDEEKRETVFEKIIHQLKEVTTIILLFAAIISLYLAVTSGHGYAEPAVIIAIVILNAVLGIKQESNAEKALEALKRLNNHTTKIIRDGKIEEIDAVELVPGDILVLEAGDKIPADARILESSALKVEESMLTGESVPVEKDPDAVIDADSALGDRLNMLFSGSLITNGRAKAIVVSTGMKTEMGKIAGLLNNTAKLKTPMQIRLSELGKKLSFIAIAAGILVFIIGLLQGDSPMTMLLTSVSLAVAAVPETLPVIVTITLAGGVQNMVRKNSIIRRIPAVETLGSASVICSDKTGTLTQNRMTIKKIWTIDTKAKKAEEDFHDEEMRILGMLALASNAEADSSGDETKIIGDPTETAIIRLLDEKGIKKSELSEEWPRLFEIPFDSDRKLMTTVHKYKDKYFTITKGAFDRIAADCTTESCGLAQKIHDDFAGEALRVIAVGYKTYDEMPENLTAGELEKDLILAGLVGMIDPPRPESKKAVAAAKKAGIRTVMITGDHIVTASAIARELGILSDNEKAVTGRELSKMSEEELIKNVRDYSVYARVSPEDKIRIVKAWQANGEVVAMTGDGVNDAPALKAADVGAAMGITGTDVSKNAADVILTDDNFATIVDAVAEGRRVYENIRKTTYFLLSCNISEIFIMLIAISLGWGVPVTAVQLLLINVVADGIPGFSLSREKIEEGAMDNDPVPKNASIFSNGLAQKIAGQAVVFTIITLLGFYIGREVEIGGMIPSYEIGQTMAFVILGWSSVVHIFNVRSSESIFKTGFMSNKLLFWCAMLSFGIVFLAAAIPPLANTFGLTDMSVWHWITAVALSVVPLLAVELRKYYVNNILGRKTQAKLDIC
ncbi:cation-translocating P-type ATPase [Sebaldella sp. S0638]|uniref:cation-translocating P-type ATPase n=1 Tax=Sebaldella sp. S0638 TaxID=2957809 RepID=UPI0020A19989|nr:cation-translocating P-type ATPase [Sebaldella sp. S0638]MCP1223747.1 cation-translocating P-type ATPase [Sebaldella sp. S0638]